MKITLIIGKPDYPYRSMKEIQSAHIVGQKAGRNLELRVMTMADMEMLRAKLPLVRGFPVYVSFDIKKQRLWLHPAPNGEYYLEVDREEEKSSSTLSLPKKNAA